MANDIENRNDTRISNMDDNSIAQWKRIYLLGGIFALISFCLTLFDIIFGSITSGDLTELPQTAIEVFNEIEQNWFIGLYHLDIINMINAMVMLPVFFAIIGVHREKNLPYATFALLLTLLGTIIFVSSNVALPMLELSGKYISSTTDTERTLLEAAGETLLVRGGHGGLGVFVGFVILTLAGLCIALVMLDGEIFSKKIAYTGVIGNIFLLIYILFVTFIPSIESIAVIVAAPGGLLVIAWIVLIGITLLKMGTN